jgi:cleavage and polyadenylation specificity factor subunit 1
MLFQHLQAHGILLNPSKCVLRATELTFLGYRISSQGSQPLPDRVVALQACTPPKTIRQLRQFLGMLNFYHRFLPKAAVVQAPLHALLPGPKQKGSLPIHWTPALLQAFE